MEPGKKNFVVHISEIPLGVKESDIKKYFKDKMDMDVRVGTVRQVKNKEIPLQWARVDFITPENYERAIEEQRFPVFGEGHSSRLLPNDRDIISKDIAEKNVFVKGLDKMKYDNEELYDMFKRFGDIDASKISKTVKEEGGKIISASNGYGFVKFADKEKAAEVLAKIDLEDSNIVVEPYLKDRKRPKTNNLYVKNFSSEVTEDVIREIFGKYGEITSCKVMEDEGGRKFGYVCFKEEEGAKSALEMHESAIPPYSDKLYVQKHVKKSIRRDLLQKAYKKQNLFIRNFGEEVTEKDLKDLFSQYGSIMNVKILTKKTEINGVEREISQCKGFVCFESPEDARKAVDEAKDKGIWFDAKRLNVSLFEPRSERAPFSKDNKASNLSPDISEFIMNFFQNMSQGGIPGMNFMGGNAPVPPPTGAMGPARAGYAQPKPPQNRPRNDMYGSSRPPQPNMPGGFGPPTGMPPQRGFPPQNQSFGPPGGVGAPMATPPMGAPPVGVPPVGAPPMGAPPVGVPPVGVPPVGAPPVGGPGMAAPGGQMMPPVSQVSEDAMYNTQYEELVQSVEYGNSPEDDKRNKFGDLIFPYVERLAGGENAPKITGMIIDLELADLEQATSTLASLKEKISEGMELLAEEGAD